MQSRLMYTLWLLFSAIYILKGASTGKLSKAARSKRYWLFQQTVDSCACSPERFA